MDVAAVEAAKSCHWNKLGAAVGHNNRQVPEVPTEHSHMLVTVVG